MMKPRRMRPTLHSDRLAGWEQGEVVYEMSRPGGSSPERIAKTTS
jgi:hypothetical protein